MPIEWLVRYWDKAAGPVLPFLRDRKVAVEQIFDHKTILRRHGNRGLPDRSGWIRIAEESQIKDWARWHVYSFHPHMNGDKDVWLVIDIDGRSEAAFDLTKTTAYEMSRLLSGKRLPHLVKFSGNRGFHVLGSLGYITPNWLSLRRAVRTLTRELEDILQAKHRAEFYDRIPKKSPALTNDPVDGKPRNPF